MQPVVVVTVDVRPDCLAQFLALAERHASQSRLEPGCRRFDVLRDLQFPFRFALHEVFDSGSALEAHRRTPHYAHWRAEIGECEAAPRSRSVCEAIDGGAVVFTNGCFDALHAGHVSLLREARAQGGRLVVAINDDESVRRLKGPGRPLWPLADRAAVLSALTCVDELLTFSTEAELLGLIRATGPDVLVKGHEPGRAVVGADLIESWGGRVHLVERRAGLSTSALVGR